MKYYSEALIQQLIDALNNCIHHERAEFDGLAFDWLNRQFEDANYKPTSPETLALSDLLQETYALGLSLIARQLLNPKNLDVLNKCIA